MKPAIPLFHGRISADGQFELSPDERELRRAYFRSLRGQSVEITVRKERTKRSLDQNGYWHAVPFPMLAEELGYESIEDLKLALMGECWGWKRDSLTGREVPVKPSTSDMDVDEGTHFTDWLIAWAAMPGNVCAHGFVIPPPRKVSA